MSAHHRLDDIVCFFCRDRIRNIVPESLINVIPHGIRIGVSLVGILLSAFNGFSPLEQMSIGVGGNRTALFNEFQFFIRISILLP